MAVVAITGGPGAPGATSAALALLLSWPLTERRRVLLVEADPDGGAVLAGALQGEVQADKGLRNLAVSDRRGRLLQEMWDQCIDLSPQGTGDRLLLPGLTDPAQAAALVYTWEPLAEACRTLDGYGCDVIVDLGRSGAHGPSAVLARRADAVLAVLRTTLRGLSTARPRVAALTAELARDGGSDALALLLIREGPYAAAEIARVLGAPVVGLLPFAPKDARILSDGAGRTSDRRFQRSELMRAARSTGDELRALTARRRLVARAATGAPQQAPGLPSIPLPAPGAAAQDTAAWNAAAQVSAAWDAAAPDLGAAPAPPTAPLRAVPTPTPTPPSAPTPFTPTGGGTRLGYRQAHAPSAPLAEPSASSRPWPPHDLPNPAVAAPAARPWAADAAPGAAPAGTGPTPLAGHAQPPVAAEATADPWPRPASQPPGPGSSAPGAPGAPWSVREVLDLAAAAELGARAPAANGPVQSPIGPVTPGQAARLQSVHLDPPVAAQPHAEPGNPFHPADMVAMPPLAEHAPRPPAPQEFRPAADAEHGDGNGTPGEVARVR